MKNNIWIRLNEIYLIFLNNKDIFLLFFGLVGIRLTTDFILMGGFRELG